MPKVETDADLIGFFEDNDEPTGDQFASLILSKKHVNAEDTIGVTVDGETYEIHTMVIEGATATEAAGTITITGIQGADGADGAEGAAGADGADGAAGADGADGADAATGRTILTRPGISVDVEYVGDVPVLTGDNTAGYTVTVPTSSTWRVLDAEALVGSAATNDATFSLTVVNADGFKDRAITQIKDLGTGRKLKDPKKEKGIDETETVSAGSVTTVFTNIGALSGFSILFTR